MFVSLSDVVPSTVNKKRANKSCYRTLQWVISFYYKLLFFHVLLILKTIEFILKLQCYKYVNNWDMLTLHHARTFVKFPSAQVSEAITCLSDSTVMTSRLLAPIPGSGDRQLMMKSAKLLASRQVFGYALQNYK